MKLATRLVSIASTLLALAGCAGGWRNGAPPGEPAASAAAAPAADSKNATHVSGDEVTFVYRGTASRVNVAGEFNSWNATTDPLGSTSDGTWTLTKKLAAGRYAYKFVIDGTNWKTDSANPTDTDDGYGGKNSIVVIGSAAAPAAAAPAASAPAKAGGPQAGADGVRFAYAGAASSVALAGAFNTWSASADPMTKQADGTWTIVKPLAPGTYAYKFVVDGTNWKTDSANPSDKDDGYGGKNSVVTVAGGASSAAAATPAPTAAPVAVTGKAAPPAIGADGVRFTFAGAATSVVLAGDFNAWSTTADPMTRQADGTWTITKKLGAGTFAYKFLVDGRRWTSDTANPSTKDDGFGGTNSILVVP